MTAQIDILQDKINWHWRNSMRPVRFFAVDGRAAIVFVILFFRLADPYAWLLVITVLGFFRYLERKGLTFPAAMRNFRAWIVGRERPGWLGGYRRKFKDFG